MFDYSCIDFIDPAFLNQYFDPTKDGAAAFPQATDEDKEVLYNGRKFTIRFSLSDGLKRIWNYFSYELAGRWPDDLGPYRLMRLESSSVLKDKEQWEIAENIKELIPQAKKEMEMHTHLYDLFEVIQKGFYEPDDDGYNVFTMPKDMKELTHEQVRRRVLCLIAMAVRLKQPDGLEAIMNMAIYKKDGTFWTGRVLPIALPGMYPFWCGLRGTARSSTEMEISLYHAPNDEYKENIATTTDLFNFPLVKGASGARGSIADAMIAPMVLPKPPERGPSKRPEVLEGKQIVSCADKEYTVDNCVKKEMDAVSISLGYDIADRVKSAFWWESPQIAALDPKEAAAIPYNRKSVFNSYLDRAGQYAREKAFRTACFAAATQAGMALALQAMPKQEDGSLTKNETLSIATLQMVNDDGVTWRVYAKAMSTTKLKIGVKSLHYNRFDEMRMSGEAEPYDPRDLIDTSEEFRALCKKFVGYSPAR